MISKMTSLSAAQVPDKLKGQYAAAMESILNYKKIGFPPMFNEVSKLNDELQETYDNVQFTEELRAVMELEAAEEKAIEKEEKALEKREIHKQSIKESLGRGYSKSVFSEFENDQLFKLHEFLGKTDLETLSDKDLKKIAELLLQTNRGMEGWIPVKSITEIVMKFEADRVNKGMEKEVKFHGKRKSLEGKIASLAKSIKKTRKGIDAEVARFDRVMKGYMSSFSGLFKSSEFSYANTIGLYVAGVSTMDNRKSQFARKFEKLLRKVKGNDWENQIKLMIYAMEKRYKANENNPNVFSVKDHIEATKKAADVNLEDVSDLEHVHDPVSHEHLHIHDEHHQHEHEGWEGPEPHRHPHRHSKMKHKHPFVIDSHHQVWPQH